MWRVSVVLRAPSPRAVFELVMDASGTPSWHSHVSSVKDGSWSWSKSISANSKVLGEKTNGTDGDWQRGIGQK
ncbi:hypothetical protein N9L68_03530 [bacterium]|nr:hypothetical protein [bacterium]